MSWTLISVSVPDIGLGFELYNCPRCMGIMLPEGGLTGNSYGLQHALSPSVVGGFSNDKIKKKLDSGVSVIYLMSETR